jgi:Ca2+-binding RTX toxin-like protein
MSDGKMSYVSGNSGDNTLTANYGDLDGTYIFGGDGNDVLKGGSSNDWLRGGDGDDAMTGGRGADQFRFFGYDIQGALDEDEIYDLTFSEGDSLVFGSFKAGTFADAAGVNQVSSGSGAIIKSFAGIANAAAGSADVSAYKEQFNGNLVLEVRNADGQVSRVVISNGWDGYLAAGGVAEAPLDPFFV